MTCPSCNVSICVRVFSVCMVFAYAKFLYIIFCVLYLNRSVGSICCGE